MQDTRSVVGKMEACFAAIVHVILVFFYLSIFQVSAFATANGELAHGGRGCHAR